jgi:hypothetical protein
MRTNSAPTNSRIPPGTRNKWRTGKSDPVLQVCKLFELFVYLVLSLATWVGGVELVECLASVHDALALNEAGGLVRALAWRRARRSRALLSSMLIMASHSSLTTASTPGKWPRALVTLRSW